MFLQYEPAKHNIIQAVSGSKDDSPRANISLNPERNSEQFKCENAKVGAFKYRGQFCSRSN